MAFLKRNKGDDGAEVTPDTGKKEKGPRLGFGLGRSKKANDDANLVKEMVASSKPKKKPLFGLGKKNDVAETGDDIPKPPKPQKSKAKPKKIFTIS